MVHPAPASHAPWSLEFQEGSIDHLRRNTLTFSGTVKMRSVSDGSLHSRILRKLCNQLIPVFARYFPANRCDNADIFSDDGLLSRILRKLCSQLTPFLPGIFRPCRCENADVFSDDGLHSRILGKLYSRVIPVLPGIFRPITVKMRTYFRR